MSIYPELHALLNAIPATFWGVVVGSFFTIAGVALTNRASDRRLQTQFDHERRQKKTDREMDLRKEVYLSAAEAISAGMNVVSRIANLDIPNDQVISDYAAKAPAIAKAHVIAQTETAKVLSIFTSQLNEVSLVLLAKRFALLQEKGAVSILDNQLVDFGKARDRTLELMKQHNIEGVVDARRWTVLQEHFEFEQNRITETIEKRRSLFAKLYGMQLELMQECTGHSATLGQAIVPVLSAVRLELELPFDRNAYLEIFGASLSSQQKAVDEFIKEVTPVSM